ncbi:hypothetical protein SteCoe_37334 [Stentor coeruleus]|uniref:Uncharacterized protein n=1 Tax=Stentor coeruleus TaxID=5963 RepID=A0A1R2AN93_9CILI|nr:hypothetical protein SteCoe_37334 [Stentor coeruleus]
MKKISHKSSASTIPSAFTTRGPSVNMFVNDRDIEEVLFSPRVKHVRKASCQNIEEELLHKYSESQIQIANMRQIEKSKQLSEMRQAPSLYPGSKKIFKPKSQEEIKAIADSIPKKRIKAIKERKIDTRRPQDVIPMPDTEAIKHALEKVTPREQKEDINVKGLNIVEKTNFFLKKKTDQEKQGKQKKLENDLEQCTFKPNLDKPKPKVSHRKSLTISETIYDKQPLSARNYKNDHLNILGKETLRTPAPNKGKGKDIPITPDLGVFISPSYSQLSPTKMIYSLGEEGAFKNVQRRSKKMLTYNIYTNRK